MINIPIVNIITNSSDRNEEKDCEIKLMMIESESNDYIDNIIRCKNHFPALWEQKMSNYETAKFIMNRLATIQIKELVKSKKDYKINPTQKTNFFKIDNTFFSTEMLLSIYKGLLEQKPIIWNLYQITLLIPYDKILNYGKQFIKDYRQLYLKALFNLLNSLPSDSIVNVEKELVGIELYLFQLYSNEYSELITKLSNLQLVKFAMLFLFIESNLLSTKFKSKLESMSKVVIDRDFIEMIKEIIQINSKTEEFQIKLCKLLCSLNSFKPLKRNTILTNSISKSEKLFLLFLDSVFYDKLSDIQFIEESRNFLKNFYDEIIKMKIKIKDFLNFGFIKLNQQIFQDKIKMIAEGSQDKIKELNNYINIYVDEINNLKNCIISARSKKEIFFKGKQINEIEHFLNKLSSIDNMTIEDITNNDITSSYNEVKILLDYLNKFESLMNSMVFQNILSTKLEQKDNCINYDLATYLLEKALNKFRDLAEIGTTLKGITNSDIFLFKNSNIANDLALICEKSNKTFNSSKEVEYFIKFIIHESVYKTYLKNVLTLQVIFNLKTSQLINDIQKIIVIEPSPHTYQIIKKFISNNISLFNEKNIPLFNTLISSKELIKFCISLPEENINKITQYFSLNTEITLSHVQSLKCVNSFFKTISYSYYTLEKLLTDINKEVWKANIIYLEYLKDIFSELQKLEAIFRNPERFQKNLISKLFNENTAIITIERIKEDKLSWNTNNFYEIKSPLFKNEAILKECWERSLLETSKQRNNDESRQYSLFEKFYKIVQQLFDEKNLLNISYKKGCDDYEIVKNEISEKKLNKVYKSSQNETTYSIFMKELKKYINEIDDKTENAYEDCYYLTFLYGRQFSIFDNYLYKSNEHLESYIDNILLYITGKKVQNKTNALNAVMNMSSYDIDIKKFQRLKRFLESYCSMNNITQNSLYANYLIPDIKKIEPGIYIHKNSINIEYEIINVFYQLTEKYPLSSSILLCNENTTIEELIAFVYRSMKCNEKTPFIIGKINLIENSYKRDVFDKIKKLGEKGIASTIIFVAGNDEEKNEIESILNYSAIFKKELPITKVKVKVLKNVTVYSSNYPGVGKTRKIQEDAKNKNLSVILFPFGNDSPLSELYVKIKNIVLNSEKNNTSILVHIMLYDSQKTENINEFLFYFIFMKYYATERFNFYIKNNIEIAIEIPNSFSDYFKKYPILSFFSRSEPLTINTFSNFTFEQDNDMYYLFGVIGAYLYYLDLNMIQFIDPIESGTEINYKDKLETIKNLFKNKSEYVNYYQLNSFIKILGNFFVNFNNNSYFSPENLEYNKINTEYRKILVQNFIHLALLLSRPAFNLSDNRKEDEMDFFITNNEPFGFRDFPSGVIINNKDKASISIIFKDKQRDEETKTKLLEIWNSQQFNAPKLELVDYYTLSQSQFKDQLKKYFNLNVEYARNPISKIPNNYVFTIDNYFKMILLDVKLSLKIPVVLLGETGCGKTLLLETLSIISGKTLKTLNVHAGITEKDVFSFMEGVINQNNLSDFWIFFDEINTSNAIGLIEEIMINHSMRGIPISNKLTFIAACNPYKKKNIKNETKRYGLINKKAFKNQDLVYNVLPLPLSFNNFICNFGSLLQEDENSYIEQMIKQIKMQEEDEVLNDNLKTIASKLIEHCQLYLRGNYEVSSVSLRDVRRFGIFYKFYVKMIKDQRKINKENVPFTDNDKLTAVVLSLYICYILRLPEESQRDELYNAIYQQCPTLQSVENIKKIIDTQIDCLMNKIIIPQGIARNKPLRENIFSVFSCLLNKIPIFICGKPGCSKTLSVNLLSKSMRGVNSFDEYLKTLPALLKIPYQGSKCTTSEEIEKVFEKAQKIEQEQLNKQKMVLPFIFFDEMGLAEISENNPLKILHSYLEMKEDKKEKDPKNIELKQIPVSFVGISNWELDASKQNRGIFISRPNLGEKDLIETAKTITQSFCIPYQEIFTHLAQAFYLYQQQFEEQQFVGIKDFHGTRDFYYSIKYICKELIEKKSSVSITNLAKKAIERNFRGLEEKQYKSMKQIFVEKFAQGIPEEYKIEDCIRDNINDKTSETCSRYLILISSTSIGRYILERELQKISKTSYYFIGSQFKNDKLSQEYTYKKLRRIINHVENGDFIIMENLDGIYPSLYDLFNLNFEKKGENDLCVKITIGMVNNSNLKVGNTFRCAILLHNDNILNQDPPFLHRFEKQFVPFSFLLDETKIKKGEEIFLFFKDLMTLDELFINNCLIEFDNQILNYSQDEIHGIIYKQSTNNNRIDIKDFEKEVFKTIVKTFSQDMLLLMYYSKYKNKKTYLNPILESYKEDERFNFCDFISKISSKQQRKHIIYTFSPISEVINVDGITFFNEKLTKENIYETSVSSYKSEDDIEKEIRYFFFKDVFNLELEKSTGKIMKDCSRHQILILKFRIEDTVNLTLISEIVNNLERKYKAKMPTKNPKINYAVIFTIHLKRLFKRGNAKNQNLIDLHSIKPRNYISYIDDNFSQKFIDNLNGIKRASFSTIIPNKSADPITLFNINSNLKEIINNAYLSFQIQFKKRTKSNNDNENNFDSNNYALTRMKSLFENTKCTNYLLSKANNYLKNIDLTRQFLEDNIVVEKDIDIYSRLCQYINELFTIQFIKYLKIIEENGAMHAFLNDFDNNKTYIDTFINQINLEALEVKTDKSSNLITIREGITILFSISFFDTLSKITKDFKDEYQLLQIHGNKEKVNNCYKKIMENINQILMFNYYCKVKTSYDENDETLLNDYFLYYLSKFDNYNQSIFRSLFEIAQEKIGDNDILGNRYLEYIIWLEMNQKYFIKLSKQLQKLQSLYFERQEKIKEKIIGEEIVNKVINDINENKDNYTLLLTEKGIMCLLYILNESVLHLSLLRINNAKDMAKVMEIVGISSVLEEEYNFESALYSTLYSIQLIKDENVALSYVNALKEEKKNQDFDSIKTQLKTFEKDLCMNLKILTQKYKQYTETNATIRQNIFEYIFSNSNLLKQSYNFFDSIIINNRDIILDLNNPNFNIKPFDNFIDANYIPLTDDNLKTIFTLIICDVFAKYIISYLSQINIFDNQPYQYFINCLNEISKKNENREIIELLNFQFEMTYCKVYLLFASESYKTTNIYQTKAIPKDFVEIIHNNILIEKYFTKCLKYSLNNSMNQFQKYEFDSFQLHFLKQNFFEVLQYNQNYNMIEYFYSPTVMYFIDDLLEYSECNKKYQDWKNSNYKIPRPIIDYAKTNKKGKLLFIQFMCEHILFPRPSTDFESIIIVFDNIFKKSIDNITEITSVLFNKNNVMFTLQKSDNETTIFIFAMELYFYILSQVKTFDTKKYEDLLKIANNRNELTYCFILGSFKLMGALLDNSIEKDIKTHLSNLNKLLIKLNYEVSSKWYNSLYYISQVIYTLPNLSNNQLINFENTLNKEEVFKFYYDGTKKSESLLTNYFSFTHLNSKSIRSVINEYSNPFAPINPNSLSDYAYFMPYKTPSAIIEEITNYYSDSVLSFYISKQEELKDIHLFITKVNPLVNKIYDYYHNQQSRTQFNNMKLSDEISVHSDLKDAFNEFSTYFNFQDKKVFTINDNLECFTINKNKNNILTNKYKETIKKYNDIVKELQNRIKTKYNCSIRFTSEVYIEESEPSDIMPLLSETNSNGVEKLIKLYYNNSHYLISKDDPVNVNVHHDILIDIEKIDNELIYQILKNKSKFKSEQKDFLCKFEANKKQFRGVIDKLNNYSNYSIKMIGFQKIDKNILYYLKSNLDPNQILDFLNNLQTIIYYVLQIDSFKQEISIKDVIHRLDSTPYAITNNEFKKLFENNPKILVTEVLTIYEWVEEEYDEKLLNSISIQYNQPIGQINEAHLIQVTEKSSKKSINILIKVLKKFIFRFLIQLGEPFECKLDDNIFKVLNDNDNLWEKHLDSATTELKNSLPKVKIMVSQAVPLLILLKNIAIQKKNDNNSLRI